MPMMVLPKQPPSKIARRAADGRSPAGLWMGRSKVRNCNGSTASSASGTLGRQSFRRPPFTPRLPNSAARKLMEESITCATASACQSVSLSHRMGQVPGEGPEGPPAVVVEPAACYINAKIGLRQRNQSSSWRVIFLLLVFCWAETSRADDAKFKGVILNSDSVSIARIKSLKKEGYNAITLSLSESGAKKQALAAEQV